MKSLNCVSVYFFLFAGLAVLLVQIHHSAALKCYHCRSRQSKPKCDEESRGELQTCTDPKQFCFKWVTTKRMPNAKDEDAHVGEARVKGCHGLRTNHTLGCNYMSQYVDICYCDTDRCNTHEYVPAE